MGELEVLILLDSILNPTVNWINNLLQRVA